MQTALLWDSGPRQLQLKRYHIAPWREEIGTRSEEKDFCYLFRASPIKRHRSTKAEVEQRRPDLYDIVAAMEPMTVRQVFYQATVRGLVEKAERRYAKVQTDLTVMRRATGACWAEPSIMEGKSARPSPMALPRLGSAVCCSKPRRPIRQQFGKLVSVDTISGD
jgi:hypothetical protein